MNHEFKINDHVEWDSPSSEQPIKMRGVILEIFTLADGEYLGILIDGSNRTITEAKKIDGKWLVYRSYHDYMEELRHVSDDV